MIPAGLCPLGQLCVPTFLFFTGGAAGACCAGGRAGLYGGCDCCGDGGRFLR